MESYMAILPKCSFLRLMCGTVLLKGMFFLFPLQIAKSDAVTLAGVLQNAIDVPLLKEHFPDQPIMAYFEFSPNLTRETRQVVQDALLLKAAGLEVKPEEVSEKTGYSLAAVPPDK